MESAGKVRQISLAQIKESKNVRTEYADIEELAESIRTVGLIEPVAVKSLGKNGDGIEEYELVAGYRRHRAFQYLCDKGESFSMIDAVVVQGDKLTIQLVENLQRSDLSPRDREAGIFQLAEAGNGIKEIAARLSKGEPFVSKNLVAHKVRGNLEKEALAAIRRIEGIIAVLDKEPSLGYRDENQWNDALAGLETAKKWLADIYDLSTQALNEIQGVKKESLVDMSHRLIDEGGTVAAARRMMREYNVKAEPPPLIPPKETKPAAAKASDTEAAAIQGDIDPLAGNAADDGSGGDDAGEAAFDPGNAGEMSPAPQKPAKKTAEKPSVRSLGDPPPHKMVDLNSVQVIIKEYIDLIGNTEAGASYQYKTDAAYEIWAHLLKGL
jgi:ParB/RepB/Spo0J family partition protein